MAASHQPCQPDDGREQGDPGEEEQCVRNVELGRVVVRGAVVLRAVRDPDAVGGMDDRRGKQDERADDHEDGEADPLDVAVTLGGDRGVLNCVNCQSGVLSCGLVSRSRAGRIRLGVGDLLFDLGVEIAPRCVRDQRLVGVLQQRFDVFAAPVDGNHDQT